MNRRACVTGLGAVLPVPRVAEAQQAQMYRIGMLATANPEQRLSELGLHVKCAKRAEVDKRKS
jgi:hypothetical protein